MCVDIDSYPPIPLDRRPLGRREGPAPDVRGRREVHGLRGARCEVARSVGHFIKAAVVVAIIALGGGVAAAQGPWAPPITVPTLPPGGGLLKLPPTPVIDPCKPAQSTAKAGPIAGAAGAKPAASGPSGIAIPELVIPPEPKDPVVQIPGSGTFWYTDHLSLATHDPVWEQLRSHWAKLEAAEPGGRADLSALRPRWAQLRQQRVALDQEAKQLDAHWSSLGLPARFQNGAARARSTNPPDRGPWLAAEADLNTFFYARRAHVARKRAWHNALVTFNTALKNAPEGNALNVHVVDNSCGQGAPRLIEKKDVNVSRARALQLVDALHGDAQKRWSSPELAPAVVKLKNFLTNLKHPGGWFQNFPHYYFRADHRVYRIDVELIGKYPHGEP